MKRKTNLFYTSGPDSKFITFSNYTEALTGNYLSVNTKLFPDNFLCLNIKNLNSNTKEIFIKYLAAYYENKLAVLRDHNINTNVQIESNIYTLSYLLEAILKVVVKNDDNEYYLNVDSDNKLIVSNDNFNLSTIENLITYIGQITETDYYGTYTDIICNINCEDYNEGIIEVIENNNASSTSLTATIDNDNTLYGWENDFIIENYADVKPIFDEPNTYDHSAKLNKLIYNKIDHNSTINKTLEFNIIIPLFSYVNIDRNNNEYKDNVKLDNETQQYYIELNSGNKHCVDVPLGMWISETNSIVLEKDQTLNLYPNWSLLISSQFKPFPYSTALKKTNETSNNPESNSLGNSFATFAEVLSKMNNILDRFNKFEYEINILNNRILSLEEQVKNISTTTNIEKLNEAVVKVESSVNSQINEFKTQLNSYLNNIKWSGAQG